MDITWLITIAAGIVTILSGFITVVSYLRGRGKKEQKSATYQGGFATVEHPTTASSVSRGFFASVTHGLLKWFVVRPVGFGVILLCPLVIGGMLAAAGAGIGLCMEALIKHEPLVTIARSFPPVNGVFIGSFVGVLLGASIGIWGATRIIPRVLQF